MNAITSSITVRALRDGLVDAVGCAGYRHERVQIIRNGKPAALLIGPEESALLENLEMMRDGSEYRAAEAEVGRGRVSLDELRAGLDG